SEVVHLLGRINGANVNDLRQICQSEESPEALQGCLTTLAKLGGRSAQAEFLKRLQQAKGPELKDLLEEVEYIKQLWALRGLIPVLSDKTPLAETGTCHISEESDQPASVPEDQIAKYLRACDIAVNLIAKIAGPKFSFPVNGLKNYTDPQLAE